MWKRFKRWWKQRWCNHNWKRKNCEVRSFPNDHIVHYSEWRCTKCGKLKTNFYSS